MAMSDPDRAQTFRRDVIATLQTPSSAPTSACTRSLRRTAPAAPCACPPAQSIALPCTTLSPRPQAGQRGHPRKRKRHANATAHASSAWPPKLRMHLRPPLPHKTSKPPSPTSWRAHAKIRCHQAAPTASRRERFVHPAANGQVTPALHIGHLGLHLTGDWVGEVIFHPAGPTL